MAHMGGFIRSTQQDGCFASIGGFVGEWVGREYRLGPVERRVVAARLLAGERARVVADEVGISLRTAERIREQGLLVRRRVSHSPHRLSFEERERIMVGVAAGESDAQIARALRRARSTVGREIGRSCRRRCEYRALRAEHRADHAARRPKERKLERCPRLFEAVQQGLVSGWSPEQIAARLRVDHPGDVEMQISAETIYQSVFVQARGELRRQLKGDLRSGRTRRRQRSAGERRGRMVDMISISERPAEVEDRAVPGHWEGDLLMGANNQSAIATLVERHTRFVMLACLERGRGTDLVIDAIIERIGTLPGHLAKSLTWDQGRELAAHKRFSDQTGVEVYFCDPHAPWQRGSNENTNGLLRQYLPKGTDLAAHSQTELDKIAAQLNERPRKTLGWMTPAEKMAELLTASPSPNA
jgi:transposase, IS30 family